MVRRAEWGMAILLTALAVGCHVVFLQHAGALWRDEAGTLYLAGMPSLSRVWQYLHCDSFPIFWILTLRGCIALGLGGDAALRWLGFMVGLGILMALWFNARCFKLKFPLISLLLLGLCPAVIVWGDTLRAYGWGVLWILLTYGLVWRVVESPTPLNTTLAMLAALASVHSIYYNPVLLFAICAGGVCVALRRRLWKRAALVLGIGAVAAGSMLPYLGVLHRGADQSMISQEQFGLVNFAAKLAESVMRGGPVNVVIWILFVVAALAVAALSQSRPALFKATLSQQDLLLFSLVSLLVGGAGYFLFLRNLKFMTQSWYYAALLGVAAVSVEAMLSVLGNSENGRKWRVGMVAAAFIVIAPAVWDASRFRMTNMDRVAGELEKRVRDGDLVVVSPWYYGISFGRYYHGSASWTPLPPVEDCTIHRYDLIKKLLAEPDQPAVIRGTLDRMTAVLKAGNRVWLVGDFSFLGRGEKPPIQPPAPHPPTGWYAPPHFIAWSAQAMEVLQTHAADIQVAAVPAPGRGQINSLENLTLMMAEGWRGE